MSVNARFSTPCADCGAAPDEACEQTCPSQLVTASPGVPRPRAGVPDRRRVEGEEVVAGDMPTPVTPVFGFLTTSPLWLGEREGLSAPEGAIVALIVLGLSNQEIARALHMSMHSTKTHIRSAYRTMGVVSRTRAILWGIEHGFELTARAARLNDGAWP